MTNLGPPFVLPGHKMTKAFGDTRFRFYPCGFKARDFDTIIYVHYKPTSKQTYGAAPQILDVGADHVHFDFPDRELMFLRTAYHLGGDRPLNKPKGGKQWHSAVSLSVASSVGDDLPFDRYMINPHAFTPNTEPRLRDSNRTATSDKVIISDSGGFQLGHGSVTFIHPGELAEFYNRNVDEGVVLDIPARQLGDTDILKYTAKVQNLNSAYMKKHLKKGFRLSTVAHGISLERVDSFRRDIEEYDPEFDIMCVSGSLRFNILEALHRIVHIIETGAEYGQYHVLGVSNPPFIAALVRLAYILKLKGKNTLVTCDSSSPIAFGLKHTYYQQGVYHRGLTPTRFGNKMSSNADAPAWDVPNAHRKFASSDSISQLVGGYQDVVSSFNTTATQAYVMYMNQIELVRYVNQMCQYGNSLDHEQYKQLVNEQYRASAHSHILSQALDYLNVYYEHGIKAAFEKYKFYMPQFTGEKTLHKIPSLIGSDAETAELADFTVKKDRLVKVVKSYLKFHKTGKVPEKWKNEHKSGGPNLKVKI